METALAAREAAMSDQKREPFATKVAKQLIPSAKEDRIRAVRVILLLGLVGGSIAIAANIWFFIQENAWQMLVVAGGILGAWALLILAYRQTQLNHLDLAGFLTLAGVMLGLGIGELVHVGLTPYLGIGGGIAILLVGAMALPSQWLVWLVCLGVYGGYFWLVNALEPLQRYDVTTIMPFQWIIIAVVVSLVGLVTWQFFRILRFGTIRTRLLVTFIILVLLPSLAVGTLSSLLYAQAAREQVFDQLVSVATLKQAEVEGWAKDLISNLLLAMPAADQLPATQMVLEGSESVDAFVYRSAYVREYNRFTLIITRGQVFDEIFLVDPSGLIILSTDATREGLNEYGYPYFDEGLKGPYVSPQYLSQQTNRRIITVAAPVTDAEGKVTGLLAGRVNLERLENIVAIRVGLGDTGEVYLIGRRDLRLLTSSRYSGFKAGESYPLFSEGIQQGASERDGQAEYINYAGVPVFGSYRYISDIDMILLAEQGRSESLAAITRSVALNVGVTLMVVLIAILGALFVTNRITTPIASLARTAEKIAGGEFQLEATIPLEDEIGALAGSFNLMTSQLRQTLEGLEQQVEERTAELSLRNVYLQAAAEVGRAAASVLDPDQLIRQVVELIRERFNLYYVGLFTLDEPEEWAVLRAGTGDAGRTMLERDHRIKIGSGMIGWSIANQQPRIALRAELDDARLVNPFLPDTRSEAAIPLRSRGRVIGAITVQSDQPDAFDEATVAVFETMADQVGIAIDNARLFADSQAAYESLSRAYGEQTITGWANRLSSGQILGYRSDVSGEVVREDEWLPESKLIYEKGDVVLGSVSTDEHGTSNAVGSGENFLGVPVMVRDQIIGVIQGYKSVDEGEWRADEIEFMKEVANIVGMTLENARLYEDTQRRAENERIVADVSSRIRESLDVDTVMQTAVIELQRALGLKDITIRLGDTHE
jgi:GAF domain-containing protein/HAMP domain-containing protein